MLLYINKLDDTSLHKPNLLWQISWGTDATASFTISFICSALSGSASNSPDLSRLDFFFWGRTCETQSLPGRPRKCGTNEGDII